MRQRESPLVDALDERLVRHSLNSRALAGIATDARRKAFVGQLVDSIRRVKYIDAIRNRDIAGDCADPSSEFFDPLKAAILFHRQEDVDEAFWLVFLAIHFGKALRSGWRLVRDVYGCLGDGTTWNWERTSGHPGEFRDWLAANYCVLKGDGIPRNFGNHRKYETLKPTSRRSSGAVIATYVDWVGPSQSHTQLILDAQNLVGANPRVLFDHLYRSMDCVMSFGRTARFDFLSMIGKLGLAPIEPGSTYMQGATGPARGARLLFSGNSEASIDLQTLDQWLVQLEIELPLGPFGMQVLEDAICNWQKSPASFISFRG